MFQHFSSSADKKKSTSTKSGAGFSATPVNYFQPSVRAAFSPLWSVLEVPVVSLSLSFSQQIHSGKRIVNLEHENASYAYVAQQQQQEDSRKGLCVGDEQRRSWVRRVGEEGNRGGGGVERESPRMYRASRRSNGDVASAAGTRRELVKRRRRNETSAVRRKAGISGSR